MVRKVFEFIRNVLEKYMKSWPILHESIEVFNKEHIGFEPIWGLVEVLLSMSSTIIWDFEYQKTEKKEEKWFLGILSIYHDLGWHCMV